MSERPQHQIERWEQAVFGHRSMVSRFEKFEEETHEVLDPLSGMQLQEIEDMTPEQREYFAKECVDVIMVSLGIIGGLGHSFDELFQEKMATIYQKYNPDVARFLRRRGMSQEEAMAHMKGQWNEGQGLQQK